VAERFELTRDNNSDSRSDVRAGTGGETEADYGGDLAKDAGVDLNKYSKEYGYDDYLESGEVKDPFTVDTGTDLNDYNSGYTNEEIRDSLGSPSDDDSTDEYLNKYSTDTGNEQRESVLDSFKEDNWSDLSLDERKQSMTELADHVTNDIGVENPPEIVFRDDMPDGSYGGYNPDSNILEINENMLDDSVEAADTVAHEMWHAHQQEIANDPSDPRAEEYQECFDNYISPEYDFEGYENQMVEAEARDYAQGFKDELERAA